MIEVMVEVKAPVGEVKTGIKNGKPWAIAEQEAAVYIPGADYPVVGMIQAKTENITITSDGRVTCDTRWNSPGRYRTRIAVQTDRYRRIECRLIDRNMIPIVDTSNKKAA